MNEIITIPTGLAGWKARRLLRSHIRKLSKISDGSTDPERTLCEQLLKHGRVDLSFVGEAKDMRRAFYAVKRILG